MDAAFVYLVASSLLNPSTARLRRVLDVAQSLLSEAFRSCPPCAEIPFSTPDPNLRAFPPKIDPPLLSSKRLLLALLSFPPGLCPQSRSEASSSLQQQSCLARSPFVRGSRLLSSFAKALAVIFFFPTYFLTSGKRSGASASSRSYRGCSDIVEILFLHGHFGPQMHDFLPCRRGSWITPRSSFSAPSEDLTRSAGPSMPFNDLTLGGDGALQH